MVLDLQPPWLEFLSDLDDRMPESVAIHCIGGFVMTALYGLRRTTADLDCYEIVPSKSASMLLDLAGGDSPLARRHRVHLQLAAVASLPDRYEDRLIEIASRRFERLRLFALEAHDLALSKLARNHPVDRDDVAYLARRVPLDAGVLRARYYEELRPVIIGDPASHDVTLELWLEEFFATPS